MPADVAKFYFRLVLLGSHGTGKTSILNRFLLKKFDTKYKPTVEDLFSKEFDLGSIEIKVDFLDTSGSMQFPAMRRLSITTGSAFLIVYSVDDENSFEVLKMCVAEIQEIRPDFQEIPIVFAGNKCDIPRDRRMVTKETVSNFVYYELPRLRAKVVECSCKDGTNIDNLFRSYLSLARVSMAPSAGQEPIRVNRAPSISSADAGQANKASDCSKSHISIKTGNEDGDSAAADDGRERTSPVTTTSETLHHIHWDRRPSSMKDALGNRKSYDASVPVARKGTLFSLSCHFGPLAGGSARRRTASTTDTPSLVGGSCQPDGEENPPQEATVNLETAIQCKLSVSQQAKPRSRSLIWRSARRSRPATETPDCRVS